MRRWSTLAVFIILCAVYIPRISATQPFATAQEDGWVMIIDVDETDYIIKVIEEESGFAILGFNYLIQAEPTINYSNSVPYPYLCTDFVENSQETGGYAIVGSQDHKIIWLDTYASGNPRRNRTYSFAGYDSARPYSIDRYEDLGYIIVGWVSNSTSQVRDYILLRIDDSGNELMHTIIPGAPDTVLSRNLIRASTGGFVVFTGAQLTRLDDSGAKLWSHSFPGNPNYSPDIIECSSGGYALLNTYDGIHQNMPSKLYFRIFRYHENGTQLWNQTLEPPYFGSWSSSIIEMSSGGFTIGGRSSPYGSPDVFVLLRTDANGNVVWRREIGEPYVADHSSTRENIRLIPYSLGGIVLAGAIELQADFATDILLKWVPDEAPPSSNSTTTTTTGPTDFTDDNDLSGLLLPIVGLAGLAVLVSLVVFAKNRNINVVSNITEEGHPIG